jgi:nucleotide-binding universal stress UspA family protein
LRKLKQFVKRQARTKVQPQFIVEEGIASDQILAFAAAGNVNLIVVGTHGLPVTAG